MKRKYASDPGDFFSQKNEASLEGYYEHDAELQSWWDGPETEPDPEERREMIEAALRKERADRIEMNRKAIASVSEKVGRPLGSTEYFTVMRCANRGYEACDKKLKTSKAKHDPVPDSKEREAYDSHGWVAYMIGWKHRLWQKRELAMVWS